MKSDMKRFAEHVYTENVKTLLESGNKIEKGSFVNNFSEFLIAVD